MVKFNDPASGAKPDVDVELVRANISEETRNAMRILAKRFDDQMVEACKEFRDNHGCNASLAVQLVCNSAMLPIIDAIANVLGLQLGVNEPFSLTGVQKKQATEALVKAIGELIQ